MEECNRMRAILNASNDMIPFKWQGCESDLTAIETALEYGLLFRLSVRQLEVGVRSGRLNLDQAFAARQLALSLADLSERFGSGFLPIS